MFKEILRIHPVRILGFSSRFYSKGNFRWTPGRTLYMQCIHGNHSSKRRLLSTTEIPPSKKPVRRGPVSWVSLGIFLLTGGGIVAYVRYVKEQKRIAKEKEEKKSIGMAAIGGPFQLVDTNGKTVTDADFRGKWVLIYFGFCHCPDICPDQLEKMSEVVNRLDGFSTLPKLQPLFITVDPHRDTVEHVREYIKDFHPRLIGLTGTEEQVKKVCKAYRVYFSAGPKDEDEDYIVDHTIITYLVNPEGQFVEYYGQNRTIEEIVGAVSTKMALNQKKYAS